MDKLPIKGDTQLLAVLGDPISHTLSPAMHNAALQALGLNCVYIPCLVRPEQLSIAVLGLKALNFKGANVTIPHKQAIIGELDGLFGDSSLSGSVNTIINRNGKLYGTSTDGTGLVNSLKEEGGFEVAGKNVLLLGAGGSATAVIYSLIAAGVKSIILLNRNQENAVRLHRKVSQDTGFELITGGLERMEKLDWDSVDLLINATSVGLKDRRSLVPRRFLRRNIFVYDLVYRSGEVTTLIEEARKAGCATLSGLSLLLYQGAESFRLWFEIEPPIKVMRKALKISDSGG
ncbi:MAG: shikimate dehydrogenase [Firmicutes bacterium]|nr:shikimate dehydrogenase [Bacillota bacterium]